MKLKQVMLAVACAFGAGNMSAQTLSYQIEGNVSGLPDGTVIVLNPISTVEQPNLATTTVNGGKFSFSGTVSELTGACLMVKDSWYPTKLILGEGVTIKVSGAAKQVGSRNGLMYSLEDVEVEGSRLTDKFQKAVGVRSNFDALYESNNEVFKDYLAEYSKLRKSGNKAALDSLGKTPLGLAQKKADSLFFKKVDEGYRKAVMANKDNFLGPLTMVSLFAYLTTEQKPWYEEFSDAAKNSQYGKMVKKDVAPDGKVGKTAPALNVVNDKGKKLTLKDLSKGKKYVLIDFWASWCKPCRAEIPNVKAQYAKYKSKGFEVVSISIDKKDADWRKALKEEQLAWPNFRDADGSLSKLWEIKFVPTMYLLDANGKIVAENARGEALAYELEKLFK